MSVHDLSLTFIIKNQSKYDIDNLSQLDLTFRKKLSKNILKEFGINDESYVFNGIYSKNGIELVSSNKLKPSILVNTKIKEIEFLYFVSMSYIHEHIIKTQFYRFLNKLHFFKYNCFLSLYLLSHKNNVIPFSHGKTTLYDPMNICLSSFRTASSFVSISKNYNEKKNLRKIYLDSFYSYVFFNNKKVLNKEELFELIPELSDINFFEVVKDNEKLKKVFNKYKNYKDLIEIKNNKITKSSLDLIKLNFQV